MLPWAQISCDLIDTSPAPEGGQLWVEYWAAAEAEERINPHYTGRICKSIKGRPCSGSGVQIQNSPRLWLYNLPVLLVERFYVMMRSSYKYVSSKAWIRPVMVVSSANFRSFTDGWGQKTPLGGSDSDGCCEECTIGLVNSKVVRHMNVYVF